METENLIEKYGERKLLDKNMDLMHREMICCLRGAGVSD